MAEQKDLGEGLTLREHLEVREKLAVLETKISEQIKAMDDARHIQAIEYERRLQALNHDMLRRAEDNIKFVEKIDYSHQYEALTQRFETAGREVSIKLTAIDERFDARIKSIERTLAILSGRESGIGIAWTVIIAIGTLIIGAISMWAGFTAGH
jgi:hypothetical protein